jgi:hypothetical protein
MRGKGLIVSHCVCWCVMLGLCVVVVASCVVVVVLCVVVVALCVVVVVFTGAFTRGKQGSSPGKEVIKS